MNLIYGTKNPAKLDYMKNVFDYIGLNLIGLQQLSCTLPDIEEKGTTPLENACIKAIGYYNTLHQPLFAYDSGLYFKDIPKQYQPGVHVRRPTGIRLNDHEMTTWYANLAKQFGSLHAHYVNAICLIMDEQHVYTCDDSSLWSQPFSIIQTPHKKRVEGFPLDCLSVRMGTGNYFYDEETGMEDNEIKGLISFFQMHKSEIEQYLMK